jgi:drug/metabolite transporter (DMT)-like permease
VDPGLSLDYVTTVLAALLVGTGFVLQQRAAAMEPASRFLSIRLIIDLFRKPRWLAGIGLLAGGDILAAWSIGHLELSLVEPLLTTYLIFALLLAVPLSGHAFRLREVIGAFGGRSGRSLQRGGEQCLAPCVVQVQPGPRSPPRR